MSTDTAGSVFGRSMAGALPTRYARGWYCLGVAKDYLKGSHTVEGRSSTKLVVFADSRGPKPRRPHMGGAPVRGHVKATRSLARSTTGAAATAAANWCRMPGALPNVSAHSVVDD